jgi:hypothetical protein
MYDYLSQSRWWRDRAAQDGEPDVACYGGLGRKPG